MVTDEQVEAACREDHPLVWDMMDEAVKERERAFYRRLLEDATKYRPYFTAHELAALSEQGVTLSTFEVLEIERAMK